MTPEAPIQVIDIDTLQFPADLVDVIGFSVNIISRLKKKGCIFAGQKTCVRWVRMHLAREGGSPELAESLYSSPDYSGRVQRFSEGAALERDIDRYDIPSVIAKFMGCRRPR